MFNKKTYSKIIAGFQKTISDCEQLIISNVEEDKQLVAEIDNLEVLKKEASQKREDLEAESRKAGALISKLKSLIEE